MIWLEPYEKEYWFDTYAGLFGKWRFRENRAIKKAN